MAGGRRFKLSKVSINLSISSLSKYVKVLRSSIDTSVCGKETLLRRGGPLGR